MTPTAASEAGWLAGVDDVELCCCCWFCWSVWNTALLNCWNQFCAVVGVEDGPAASDESGGTFGFSVPAGGLLGFLSDESSRTILKIWNTNEYDDGV